MTVRMMSSQKRVSDNGLSSKRPTSIIWRGMYLLPIVFASIVLYVLNTTNPTTSGILGILVVFLLFYAFCLSVFFVFIHLSLIAARRIGLRWNLDNRKAYYLATIVALMPVFLLALNSIGQLRFLDVFLVLCFVVFAGFYVLRRTAK